MAFSCEETGLSHLLLMACPPSLFFTVFFFISLVIVIALNTFDNAEVTYFVHSSADSAVACRFS